MSAATSSQPAQKRRRSAEGPEAYLPVDEMTRDSTLWYSDGNVVVGAGTTLFRVHKSILSQHSTVFNGLFDGFPHTGDCVDNCPFVRLFGDDPLEVRLMLREMYGLRDREDRKVSIELLCALVRLGRKYDIVSMQRQGASVLRELYGPDFAKFKSRQHAFDDVPPKYDPFKDQPDFPVTPWRKEYCFIVYVLARDHDMEDVAARALYECCRRPFSDLTPALVPTLNPDIFAACALGREKLAKVGAAQLMKLDPEYLENNSDPYIATLPCENKKGCKRLLGATFNIVKVGLVPENPLAFGWNRRDGIGRLAREGLCVHCRMKVDDIMRTEARDLWESLPDILATAMKGFPV